MNTEEENGVFLKHKESLTNAIIILDNRIKKLEDVKKENFQLSIGDMQMNNAIIIFKERSLNYYRKILSFISHEVDRNESEVYFFLMPHVRTLLDIYARLLHLLEKSKSVEVQALTCIAYQLLSYKRLGQPFYEKTLAVYDFFIKNTNVAFPDSQDIFGKRWVEKNKINFANTRTLLTLENISKYSSVSSDVFQPKETYLIYSHFSEFIHGNPYFWDDSSHNEKFWIVSMCISTTALFVDVIDKYTIKKINQRDFRTWLADVKKTRKDFLDLWKSKRKYNPNL